MTPLWGTFSAGAARRFGRGFVPAGGGGGAGGKLFAWGYNGYGQLGQSNTTNYSSPIQIGSGTTWSKLGSNYFQHNAIKTDGTMWAAGYNGYYNLGTGNTTQYTSPVQVGSDTDWSFVADLGTDAGDAPWLHAVKTNGSRWSAGYDGYGQCGYGSTTSYRTTLSQPYSDSPGWSMIAQGDFHTMGIKTNGTLWGWGRGYEGQIGNNGTSYYASPVQIGAGTNWSKVACGYMHTIAVKTDGTIWSWGDGGNGFGAVGQLGFNTSYTYSCYICTCSTGYPYYQCCGGYYGTCTNYYNYSSPVQIGSGTTWADVAAGAGHVLARKTDGTLWVWGYNSNGQLGVSNSTNYSSPVQVGAGTTWSKISGGYAHTLATKTDGTLWAWGYNGYGNLGTSNTTSYSSPVQVGSGTGWTEISAGGYSSFGISTT